MRTETTHQTLQESAECLRMALPLMSKHRIPTTPPNYAVWYEYVAGSNHALEQEIRDRIEKGEDFSEELNQKLFERFVSGCNIERMQQIRSEMSSTVQELVTALSTNQQHTDEYSGVLQQVSERCAEAERLDDLSSLLNLLLQETRKMNEATLSLHQEFEERTREMEELRRELEQAKKESQMDPLTGLSNRIAFREALQRAVEDYGAEGDLCLLMLDIDNFKLINDTHGHLVGDKVICFVAGLLQEQQRDGDTAARYGGEEYALLLPRTDWDQALEVAESIRKAMEHAKLVRSGTKEPLGEITLSAGVARYISGEAPETLVERADQALYQAKSLGRNRVHAD